MRKKLQTYQGVIAYKADKTPVKRVFYGRSKAEAKQNILHISLNMGRLKNVPTCTRCRAGPRSGCFCTSGPTSQIRHIAPHMNCQFGGISFQHLDTCFWWM